MLRTILSISGKPGLFKLVSQGKNMVIVESLINGKRVPAYSHEKIISLGDISIYTEEAETPLREVFKSIFSKEEGKEVTMPAKENTKALNAYFGEILPTYDREKVYPNDIRKVLGWYNILVTNGITDFDQKEEETKEAEK